MAHQFDDIARDLASGTLSRRSALWRLIAAAAGALAASVVGSGGAQARTEGERKQERCGHGTLVNSTCVCETGWGGANCTVRCENGVVLNGTCVCYPGFAGKHCQQEERDACVHGTVLNGTCVCEPGWTGPRCDVPVPS